MSLVTNSDPTCDICVAREVREYPQRYAYRTCRNCNSLLLYHVWDRHPHRANQTFNRHCLQFVEVIDESFED